jgi:hypothetical protein
VAVKAGLVKSFIQTGLKRMSRSRGQLSSVPQRLLPLPALPRAHRHKPILKSHIQPDLERGDARATLAEWHRAIVRARYRCGVLKERMHATVCVVARQARKVGEENAFAPALARAR